MLACQEHELDRGRQKELEAQGLVHRRVLCDRPIAVTYEVTEFGRSATRVLELLKKQADENGI